MKLGVIMGGMVREFKQNLKQICEKMDAEAFSPESAEAVWKGFYVAAMKTVKNGFAVFLEHPDETAKVLTRNGERFRFKQRSLKAFLTPCGEIQVWRRLYQRDAGGESLVPLDEKWGMAGEYAMPEAREAMLYLTAHVPPKEAAACLKKAAAFHPSATVLRRTAEAAGQWVEDEEEALLSTLRSQETVPAETRVLAVGMDGTNVLLNEPGLKKGRPGERPGQESDAESPTSYRNAMVASVSFYGEVPPGEKTPKRLDSRYLARMPEPGALTLKQRLEQELDAWEKRLSPDVIKVMLCDAHRALWKYIDRNPRFVFYLKLVDFYHATEHLSLLAEALFGKQSEAGTAWYHAWKECLLEEDGAVKKLLRAVDYQASRRGLSADRRKAVAAQRTFFRRNRRRMTYAAFRRRGLPIGSGPTEAACKAVVKTRLCRSGMRWTREGGQHVLHLRALVKSGRWETFWAVYRQLKKTA